jgi:hypothetical protein
MQYVGYRYVASSEGAHVCKSGAMTEGPYTPTSATKILFLSSIVHYSFHKNLSLPLIGI